MGRPNIQTQGKRQREQAKKDKRREKDAKRAARKAAKAASSATPADLNPPVAAVERPGLVPARPPLRS